jgi:hypothetical protein
MTTVVWGDLSNRYPKLAIDIRQAIVHNSNLLLLMKSIYDLNSYKGKYRPLFGFLRALLIIIVLLCVVAGIALYLFARSFIASLASWDDANLKYSKNSKESWNFFTTYVSPDIRTIKNVSAENHSNIRQRDYLITFQTDSATLLDLVLKKRLNRLRDCQNGFALREGRTWHSLGYSRRDTCGNFEVSYTLTDCGWSSRDTSCDNPEIRCSSDIIDKEVEFLKTFYDKYRDSLSFHNFHTIKDCTVYYTIYSDGSVDSVSIVDKWNSFDDAFHHRIVKEFKKVNFGKKSRKKPISWSFPVAFP